MKIPSELQKFKRSFWLPITEEDDGALTDSKFAGKPFLHKDEDYPICPNCGKPMQFFIQLNLDRLPTAQTHDFGHGILQMFYCINTEPLCEVDCSAFFPFAKSVLVRTVPPEKLSEPNPNISEEGDFPPKLVTGWKEGEDYPNTEEASLGDVEIDYETADKMSEAGYPQPGDKLAGYPMWIQGVEYPDCPTCGEKMRLVFQIDSEDNLPYSFGDLGCGHITQCPTHKEISTFGWACG